METLNDWLLHNTGNAGNHYTILNTRRAGADSLTVMARSSDFNVVNLLIRESKNEHTSDKAPGKDSESSYIFADEQQLINFLTGGEMPPSQPGEGTNGIHVLITEPDGEAGDVTFPTAQS